MKEDVRTYLDEVSFVRPILILLMVLYHSMAMHTGNWEMPEGSSAIPAYKAIGRLAQAFMLESFVLISGYVWAFQRETKGRKENFWTLCRKKAVRLLVPAIFFGFIYCIALEGKAPTFFYILEGPGHLWFLPMLFECFLISWCILRSRVSLRYVLPILFLIGICIPSGLPLRLSYTFYYLPFFLLGYYMYGCYDASVRTLRPGHLIVAWVCFFFFFLGMVFFRVWIDARVQQPILLGMCISSSKALPAITGSLALLITAIYLTKNGALPAWYYKVGALCMGVYIFQQFVLEILYYHTSLPAMVSGWLLPWIGFTIALSVSLALAFLVRLNRVGRLLI